MNTEPVIFDGGRLPGALIRAAAIRNARAALDGLQDAEFAQIVTEAMRNRPARLAHEICDKVFK